MRGCVVWKEWDVKWEKSEIERKEKRDHESKKERDDREREKQDSLSEVISYSNSNIPTSYSSCFDSLISTHEKVYIKKPS